MSNATLSSNTILGQAVDSLRVRLPASWSVSVRQATPRAGWSPDAVLELRSGEGTTAAIAVEIKRRLTGQAAALLAAKLATSRAESDVDAVLVLSPYLGAMARQRLREAGIAYLDLTGNMRLVLESPALFIDAQGADQDPAPVERDVRRLKGPKAGRLVRALCDWRSPVGIRELARRAGTDTGYTARVVRFLTDEDLVKRSADGAVADVQWADLLRRWASDIGPARQQASYSYIAARGLEPVLERLRVAREQYAVTGSLAVPDEARSAPGRMLSCYVDDVDGLAERLRLRTADSGANVTLIEAPDPIVFEGGRREAGINKVAVSQCAADLMGGMGREPSEAESLISWMSRNEGRWRA